MTTFLDPEPEGDIQYVYYCSYSTNETSQITLESPLGSSGLFIANLMTHE